MSNARPPVQTVQQLDGSVDVMEIVHAAFFTPMGNLFTEKGEESWGLPMFFEGPPGASKTSKFYQFARRYGIPFESLKPGSRGEGFFGCTPTRGDLQIGNENVAVLDFPLPRKFVKKFMSGAGLILLDELPNAQPAVKPALLGFLQEKELGEMKFGPRVRVMGAGNKVEESPAGYEFSPPEANRMGHMQWPDPAVRDVVSFLTSAGRRDEDEEVIDVAEVERQVTHSFYSQSYPIAAGLIGGFLDRHVDMLRRQPNVGDAAASGPWASPRTWEYATRAYASALNFKLSDAAQEAFVASFIGSGPTREFMAWKARQDLPSPAEILDGKVVFKHERTRLDRTSVVLNSCVAFMNQPNLDRKMERGAKMWNMIGEIAGDAADLCMGPVNSLSKAKLTAMPEARKVLAMMDTVATAARK